MKADSFCTMNTFRVWLSSSALYRVSTPSPRMLGWLDKRGSTTPNSWICFVFTLAKGENLLWLGWELAQFKKNAAPFLLLPHRTASPETKRFNNLDERQGVSLRLKELQQQHQFILESIMRIVHYIKMHVHVGNTIFFLFSHFFSFLSFFFCSWHAMFSCSFSFFSYCTKHNVT